MPPCRNKSGKFVACRKSGKDSHKRSKKRKEKESRSRPKKRKTSTHSRRKSYSRKVPRAPRAPSSPGGILRPGYYGRVSRPPPAFIPAPSGMSGNLCWTNRNKQSCDSRKSCVWDKSSEACISSRRGGRAAALRLGGSAGKLPTSVCGTTSTKSDCNSVHGCRWSDKGKVCVPKKAEEYLPEYNLNQPW